MTHRRVPPPSHDAYPIAPRPRRRGLSVALALATALVASESGTREATARIAADHVAASHGLSARTREILARHGLLPAGLIDPEDAALRLEAALATGPSVAPSGILALAELWYRASLRRHRDPASAVPHLRAAAAAAMLALAGPDPRCLDRAVEIHNSAVSRLVRLAREGQAQGAGTWSSALSRLGVAAAGSDPFVDPGRFAAVVVADDAKASGMKHMFRVCGIGVPVVGTRLVDRQHPTGPDEAFFPRKLQVAATALAAPGGGLAGGAYRLSTLTLVFHDPFRVGSVRVGGRALQLAADRTTPLALQASQGQVSSQVLRGLFAGDFGQEVEPGLYLLRPYAPGKIPVVFVHGLASSPVAFMQAINAFQNDPVLSARYQFWTVVYPTGRSIVGTAARLREALGRAEAAYGDDPSFHRMVVVGHSMGGILTHMMVSDSGREVWAGALNVPPEELRTSPATRAEIDRLLFFRPLPYVSRVVFVATPHRGSRLAGGVVGRAFGRRMRPPADQAAVLAEIEAFNGPNVVRDENFQGASINSIGNLREDSPLLLAVSRLPVAPGVAYHTIAFRLGGHAPGDLVVPLQSAHLDSATSETILPGTHGSEQAPATLGEIRRILLEHLAVP